MSAIQRWLDRFCYKHPRFGIPNLMLVIVVGNVLVWLMDQFSYGVSLSALLAFSPYYILHGQIWRIVSWILVPPQGSLLEIVIMLMLYYSLGTTLERTWGAFRYNVYIFSGILFTVLGAFVLYILYGSGADFLGGYFSTYYINLSIFLAFAASYPDMELLLYFILPIKIKWMGLVYGVYILYQLATGNPASRIVIISSLLNFVVFFLSSRNLKPYTPKEQVRKAKFRQQTRPHMTYANGAKHRCAVCGRTELDDSSLEFRFCSKCNGNYEYCQDHLFTHQHVK